MSVPGDGDAAEFACFLYIRERSEGENVKTLKTRNSWVATRETDQQQPGGSKDGKQETETMKTCQRLILIMASILIANCASDSTEPNEYELNYENCKAMAKDPNHPYRKEPIAVQGCETILFENMNTDE